MARKFARLNLSCFQEAMETAPCLVDSVSSNCIEWDSMLGIIEWSIARSSACYAVNGSFNTRLSFTSVRLDTVTFQEKSVRPLPKSSSA